MSRTEPVLVTVLRHGAVQGRAHVLRGRIDEPLSSHGAMQMEQVLQRHAESMFDAIAASPLQRCHGFASSFAASNRLVLRVMPQFSELSFGDWEGLTPDEAAARDPQMFQAFQETHGEHAPPNGESLAQFRARVMQGWHEWLEHDGRNRLLVTHAGVMRALLMELFGFTPGQAFSIALPEAACLRISYMHGQAPFLLSVN